MQRIINEGQTFVRREVTDEEALAELADEPYKLRADRPQGRQRRGGGRGRVGRGRRRASSRSTTTSRRDGSRRLGRPVPRPAHAVDQAHRQRLQAHAQRRPPTGAASRRTRSCSASTAPPGRAKDELKAYLERLAEAEKRDHRRLGAELDLFSFPDEIGSGLAVFHPKGGVIKREMEDYVRRRHIEEGFEYVGTPHITKEGLFETSGHLPYYADTMFPPMEMEGRSTTSRR